MGLFNFLKKEKRPDKSVDQAAENKVHTENAFSQAPTDDMLRQAMDLFFDSGFASTSLLQRKFYISYTKAVEILDLLEDEGCIAPYTGSTSRKLLVTREEFSARSAAHTFSFSAVKGHCSPGDIDATLLLIDSMEGHEFEYWCANFLCKLGFVDVELTPGSGDQGVDVLARKDDIKYAIQCKCYTSDLGNKPVQEVHAGKIMYNCHVGAVMTNRHFTAGGRELAEATGILLWDRDWIISNLDPSANSSTETDPVREIGERERICIPFDKQVDNAKERAKETAHHHPEEKVHQEGR